MVIYATFVRLNKHQLHMRKQLAVCILLLGISGFTYAQHYNTSAGLRFGVFPGISVKTFVNQENAIEGALSTRWDGFFASAVYEYQRPINELPDFYWYIGGGAHTGIWADANAYKQETFVLGGSFILGAEYEFQEVPFTVSLDWNPGVNLIGPDFIWFDKGALSFRYIIN